MALVFGWEPLAVILASPGARALPTLHQEDTGLAPLDIDWVQLLELERAGRWRVYTARDSAKIIGYAGWSIGPHVLYRNTTFCKIDAFFLHPDYRRGLTGYRLLKESLAALPRPSTVLAALSLAYQDGRVGQLYERLGLSLIEQGYMGELK